MRKIKIGVFGMIRGGHYCDIILMNGGEIVAVCDNNEERLKEAKAKLGDDVGIYTDFDSFIEHEGMEAVFLCNFFHEHAPYAIRALEKNIHVLSECTSNSTMAEGVQLIRAAEKSKAMYMLAENYPFMQFNREMYRVYREGTLGKILYAEGEYNHPVDPRNEQETHALRPFDKHWRNYTPRTYYITHSLAPLMHTTGSVPVRVTAMPVYFPELGEDRLFGPEVKDRAAIVTCLNDDGSVFRVTGCAGFGAHGNKYRYCCDKGQIENLLGSENGKVMLRYSHWTVPEGKQVDNLYMPSWNDKDEKLIEKAGHGGGDFIVIRTFFECIRENKKPDFDEYFSTTMASVAILSHRSLLEGGVPYDIPDFHKEEDRQKYENDWLTPFYGSNGEKPTVPCSSHSEI